MQVHGEQPFKTDVVAAGWAACVLCGDRKEWPLLCQAPSTLLRPHLQQPFGGTGRDGTGEAHLTLNERQTSAIVARGGRASNPPVTAADIPVHNAMGGTATALAMAVAMVALTTCAAASLVEEGDASSAKCKPCKPDISTYRRTACGLVPPPLPPGFSGRRPCLID